MRIALWCAIAVCHGCTARSTVVRERAPADFLIISAPERSLVGIPAKVTVRAESAAGDLVTSFRGEVTLVASGSATGAGVVNLDGGEGWLLVNDSVAESVELTLADSDNTGLDLSSSATVVFHDGATEIYRSVGPGNASALAVGNGNRLTVDGCVARLQSPLPTHAGVGDVLEYDSNDDGVADTSAFVHRRYSSTDLCVRSSAGNPPVATTAATQIWQLFRAYDSLPAAMIDVEGVNAVTANEVWHFALYADAAQTTFSEIDLGFGWTTGPNNYLRIFVPKDPIDVGTSQRHSGRWRDDRFRLEVTNNNAFQLRASFVRIEGLQIRIRPGGGLYHAGIYPFDLPGGSSAIHISHNIIRMDDAVGEHYGIEIDDSSPTMMIRNNVFFGFAGTYSLGIRVAQGRVYIYNNTIADCYYGVELTGGTAIAKNNIVDATTEAFYGLFDSASNNNLANDTTSTGGSQDRSSISLAFVNPTGGDYHLSPADTAAIDTGIDLRGDSYLPFNDDIDGELRGEVWSIGADEP